MSSLHGYRSVLSAVFRFHLPSLSSDQVLRILLRSFQLSSAECVLRPHTWDLSMVLPYLVSPAFEPLSQAFFPALPLTTLFLLALATAIRSWGATGSLFQSHLCGWGCLPLLHPAVCHQVGVAHPFLPSLLLGDVLSTLRLVLIPTSYYARSGLSACICFGPGLRLQVAIAFSCPLGALLALFYERGVVLFGGRS